MADNDKKQEVGDFVLIPTMTPRDVVSFLLTNFPMMRNFICPDEECFEEPTRVYDSFATQVVKSMDDCQFINSVGYFINDAAANKDPLLREVLIADLLEGIAVEPEAARRLSRVLNENARKLLCDVEARIYGREEHRAMIPRPKKPN